MLQLSLAHCF